MRRRFRGHAARERQVAALIAEMRGLDFHPDADLLGRLLDFIQGQLRAEQIIDSLLKAGHAGPVALSLSDAHNSREAVVRRTYPEVRRPLDAQQGSTGAKLRPGSREIGHSAVPLHDQESAQGFKTGAHADVGGPVLEFFHVERDGEGGES